MIDYNIRGMNKHIVEANVKLQDENKLLKEDKEILKRRIEKAIEYAEESYNETVEGIEVVAKFFSKRNETLLKILKGEYVKEEK